MVDPSNISDRVWMTLLFEFSRYAESHFPGGAEPADKQAAYAAFLGFLRENAAILDLDALVKWVNAKGAGDLDEALDRHLRSVAVKH